MLLLVPFPSTRLQAFLGVIDMCRSDMYLHPHTRYYMRELQLMAYNQVGEGNSAWSGLEDPRVRLALFFAVQVLYHGVWPSWQQHGMWLLAVAGHSGCVFRVCECRGAVPPLPS